MAKNVAIKLVDDSAGLTTADKDFGFDNPDCAGADIIIDVTAHNPDGTPGSLIVTVQGVDPASGKKYTILASAAIITVSTVILRIGRGLTAAANAVANSQLPSRFNVNLARSGNAHPMKFTVGMNLIR